MRAHAVLIAASALLLTAGCGGHKRSGGGSSVVLAGTTTSQPAGDLQPAVRVGYVQADGSVSWVQALVDDPRRSGEYVGAIDVHVPPPSSASAPVASLFGVATPAPQVPVRLGYELTDGTVQWTQPQVIDQRQADGALRGVDVYVPVDIWSGGATAAPTSTASAVTAPSGQVGSPYWYQGDTFGNPLEVHSPEEEALAGRVLALVNQERASLGLPALAAGAYEQAAAKAHVEDMASRSYFSHFTPEGWTVGQRLQMLGGSFSRVAENLAGGQATPEAVVRSWMESPGHRAEILDPTHTRVGVGVHQGQRLWALVFSS